MKTILTLISIATTGLLHAAVPRIVEGSVGCEGRGSKMIINYELADAAGIVTAEVQTNGVSIGETAVSGMTGDVNALVQVGKRQIVWTRKARPAELGDATVKVVLKATAEQLPPDYMVVDLVSGAINYYTSTNALPGGLGDDVYRKTKMVFRKIHAANKIWRIGESAVVNRLDSTYHNRNRTGLVSFTYDYWAAVFELTHAQVKAVTGAWAPAHVENVKQGSSDAFKNRRYVPSEDDWSMCPADGLSIAKMRGSPSDEAYLWPQKGRAGVDPNSFLGILRRRTGGKMPFDMPTSAEWEYAARGGCSASQPWGSDSISTEELGLYAWYSGNSNVGDFTDQYGSGRTHRVGEKRPNAWGLYDTLGNISEMTLDYNPADEYLDTADRPYEIDPVGLDRTQAKSGYLRKIRGGAYSDGGSLCRVTMVVDTNLQESNSGVQWFGHRVFCPIAWKPHTAVETAQPTIAFDAETREATISYRLDGTEPKIVTLDVLTNGYSIGAVNFAALGGDVNRVVQPGYRTIYWRPDHTWAGHFVDTSVETLTVEIREYQTNNPPCYAALDLSGAMTPMYYESADAVPGGVGDMYYKSDCLLMRKVPAAGVTWRMGCNTSAYVANERGHLVQLSGDFWMSVYGMTQRQYYMLVWGWPAKDFYGSTRYDLPVLNVSWTMARGGSWPSASGHDDIGSKTPVAVLRSWFPDFKFDLPTEAQREFAARGGKRSTFSDGSDDYSASNLDNIRKFSWNANTNSGDPNYKADQPHAVGLLDPNGYGLYDLSGNELEWCLDWFADDIRPSDGAVSVDPAGPTSGSARSLRGCAYSDGWSTSRVHFRGSVSAGTTDRWRSFRLVAPVAP